MPAPVTVADDEIEDAGRALAAEGRSVNGWSLRRALGRGDPVRLNAVWVARQSCIAPVPDAEAAAARPLPPVVAEHVEALRSDLAARAGELGTALWVAAERVAAERLHGEAEAARAEAAALYVQLDEAREVVAAADAAREAAEREAEGLRARLAAVEAEAVAARGDLERRLSVAEAVALAAREDLRLGLSRGGDVPAPAV